MNFVMDRDIPAGVQKNRTQNAYSAASFTAIEKSRQQSGKIILKSGRETYAKVQHFWKVRAKLTAE
jgi:hypothetical protein